MASGPLSDTKKIIRLVIPTPFFTTILTENSRLRQQTRLAVHDRYVRSCAAHRRRDPSQRPGPGRPRCGCRSDCSYDWSGKTRNACIATTTGITVRGQQLGLIFGGRVFHALWLWLWIGVSRSGRYGRYGQRLILAQTDHVGSLTLTYHERTGSFLPMTVIPQMLVLAAPKASPRCILQL
jgi:hypothetical protein